MLILLCFFLFLSMQFIFVIVRSPLKVTFLSAFCNAANVFNLMLWKRNSSLALTSLLFLSSLPESPLYPPSSLHAAYEEIGLSLLEEGWPGLDNWEYLSECPILGKGNCHSRIGTKWLIFLRVRGVFCSPSHPALLRTLHQHVRQRD